MDLLQGVKESIWQKDDEQGDIPLSGDSDSVNLEKLLTIMKKLNLSDANEEQLRETLIQKSKMGMLGGFMPDALKKFENHEAIRDEQSEFLNMLYLALLVSLIFMVLVFFGYKLYKSHTDRERKREEKRRLKQQKKKK